MFYVLNLNKTNKKLQSSKYKIQIRGKLINQHRKGDESNRV